ncbi:pepsin/retropepsin-like aspartic protease family protein [Asticcacaulis sp. 201]|uniref:pepsin/retropepsin-like aspartic protease family protein n=1 Tax=Asticcacaulis sp. 201 TaxID=3028787 RepID=UPI002916B605|nr:pepsin/retropepsin-like aspartic protease family protein [Asticcacaulis sp. 201]MDV6330967.1 pepsin/retropepsin-like aspartic protease family protein [Asticcacaulis sp. 201]
MLDTLPFEYASAKAPLLVVKGQLGESRAPVSVVLDTGAGAPFSLFLSTKVAKSLSLALSDEIVPETSTAVGSKRQGYRTADLPFFSLGPVKLVHTPVAVLPMIDDMAGQIGRPVDAIIGYQFLRDRRFSINYPMRKIDLSASAPSEGEAIAFTLAAKKPIILVQAKVNGEGPFTFEIDTGATVTSLSPETAARAHITPTGEGVLGGAGGAVTVKRADANLAVGTVKFDLKNVTITDSLTGISTAAGSQIDGIVGLDYFYRTTLIIDYPNAKVWIALPK